MRTVKILPIFLALLIAACSSPPATEQAQTGDGAVLLEGARLIVGDGSAPIENAAFLVADGKIARVGLRDEIEPPNGAVRMDLAGKVSRELLGHYSHIRMEAECRALESLETPPAASETHPAQTSEAARPNSGLP